MNPRKGAATIGGALNVGPTEQQRDVMKLVVRFEGQVGPASEAEQPSPPAQEQFPSVVSMGSPVDRQIPGVG